MQLSPFRPIGSKINNNASKARQKQCQTNVLSRSEAFVLMLSFQKRANVNVFESKFWIATKRFLSVLKIFGPKAIILFCLIKTLVQFETIWF
jgi:hypothetical protein